MKLRAEFDKVYSPNIVQGSMAAPVAPLGAGAGNSTPISAPPPPLPPRLAPSAPTVPVEMLEQRKECRQKQLANHWKQVQNSLATCLATNLLERQEAYDTYLTATAQFKLDFPPEVPPVNTTRCRSETDTAGAGVRFQAPISQSTGPAVQQRIYWNSSLQPRVICWTLD